MSLKVKAIDKETRAKIEDMITDYVHCIDDDRLEEWPAFFTDDCVYKVISRQDHEQGRPIGIFFCDNKAMLKDRVFALREANIYESHSYRHMISASRFLPGDDCTGGTVEAHTNFHVVRTMENGSASMFATGKYVDRIVFEEGQPKFQQRLVVMDSHRIDTLLVIPL